MELPLWQWVIGVLATATTPWAIYDRCWGQPREARQKRLLARLESKLEKAQKERDHQHSLELTQVKRSLDTMAEIDTLKLRLAQPQIIAAIEATFACVRAVEQALSAYWEGFLFEHTEDDHDEPPPNMDALWRALWPRVRDLRVKLDDVAIWLPPRTEEFTRKVADIVDDHTMGMAIGGEKAAARAVEALVPIVQGLKMELRRVVGMPN